MHIGILGYPRAGKSTLFRALLGHKGHHAGGRKEGYDKGVVKVPDSRIDFLAELYQPKKVTYAEIEFWDSQALDEPKVGPHELPAYLRQTDSLVAVIAAFENPNVAHPKGSVNSQRDIDDLNAELVFSDLISVEKRLGKLANDLKRGHKEVADEIKFLERLKTALEANRPLRSLDLTVDERRAIRGFEFLSLKPVLWVINIGEGGLPRREEIEASFSSTPRSEFYAVCAEIEAEIAELPEADRPAFLADLGIAEPALFGMIRHIYHLSGLISFFTAGEPEVRAWTVPKGAKAPQAAGVIHSDFEKGFIRAEVVHFDRLKEFGNIHKVKEKGQLRLEGKEYLVQDGDVILFRFNV
ncbi:MAG: redox-regulated ATPase YchF [Limisphaerales bacterium]